MTARSSSMEKFFVWTFTRNSGEIIGGDFDDHKGKQRAKRRDQIEAAKKEEFVVLLDFVIR